MSSIHGKISSDPDRVWLKFAGSCLNCFQKHYIDANIQNTKAEITGFLTYIFSEADTLATNLLEYDKIDLDDENFDWKSFPEAERLISSY